MWSSMLCSTWCSRPQTWRLSGLQGEVDSCDEVDSCNFMVQCVGHKLCPAEAAIGASKLLTKR
jgi:hypothetical protein